MDLHEFNTRVLNSIGVLADADGYLSIGDAENQQPFMIGKKRVVLPTSEHLRNGEDGVLIYHPLSENITRSESDMIKAMRDIIMYKLTVTAVALITELGRVAATDSEHKRLDAPSSEYLKKMRDMDEKSYEFLKKLIMRIGREPEKRLISISLRKGDQADGVRRMVKFKFPVIEQLVDDDKEVLGLKYPSKKARANVIALFEIVLGDLETRAEYDYGSKNLTAPYFHSLMTGFANIATRLNDVVKRHKKLLGAELVEQLTIDLSWQEAMDDLSELRKKVPPQEGNEGAIIVSQPKEREKVAEKVASRLAPPRRESTSERQSSRQSQEEVDVPWDDDDKPVTTKVRSDQPRRDGKTLDDFLYGDRRARDDRRGSRYDRDERSSRFDRDRRDRDDRRGGRSFDLGLDSDRDRRDRDDRGWSSRSFRRDDRGSSRRPFGAGHGRAGF